MPHFEDFYAAKLRGSLGVTDAESVLDLRGTNRATAEASLAGGLTGVLVIALIWGLFLAWSERLVTHHRGMGRIFGLTFFAPWTHIEVGMFPMVQGLRGALIASGLVFLIMVVWLIIARNARSARNHRARLVR